LFQYTAGAALGNSAGVAAATCVCPKDYHFAFTDPADALDPNKYACAPIDNTNGREYNKNNSDKFCNTNWHGPMCNKVGSFLTCDPKVDPKVPGSPSGTTTTRGVQSGTTGECECNPGFFGKQCQYTKDRCISATTVTTSLGKDSTSGNATLQQKNKSRPKGNDEGGQMQPDATCKCSPGFEGSPYCETLKTGYMLTPTGSKFDHLHWTLEPLACNTGFENKDKDCDQRITGYAQKDKLSTPYLLPGYTVENNSDTPKPISVAWVPDGDYLTFESKYFKDTPTNRLKSKPECNTGLTSGPKDNCRVVEKGYKWNPSNTEVVEDPKFVGQGTQNIKCASGWSGKDCTSIDKNAGFMADSSGNAVNWVDTWKQIGDQSVNFSSGNNAGPAKCGVCQTFNCSGSSGTEGTEYPVPLCDLMQRKDNDTTGCVYGSTLIDSTTSIGGTIGASVNSNCSGLSNLQYRQTWTAWESDQSDSHQYNIGTVSLPEGVDVTWFGSGSSCASSTSKLATLKCTKDSCTTTGDNAGNDSSFKFSLAPGYVLKCKDAFFFGPQTSTTKIPSNYSTTTGLSGMTLSGLTKG
jgi:hypothetical protein